MLFRASFGNSSPGIWKINILLGIFLMSFGVLIYVMPELLSFLVAFGFFSVGFGVFMFGLKIRGAEKNIKQTIIDVDNF